MRRLLVAAAYVLSAIFALLALKAFYDFKWGGLRISSGVQEAPPSPLPARPLQELPNPESFTGQGLGAPIGANQPPSLGYTNESLHAFLDDQMRQERIKVLPKGSISEENSVKRFLGMSPDGVPMSREAAMALMRQGRRGSGGAKGGVVPILGSKVGLIGSDKARPLRAPPGVLREGDAWAGEYSGGLDPGGRTVADQESWARLWSRLSSSPPPRVDFSRLEVVGYFLGLQAGSGSSVEILSADPQSGWLKVRYAVKPTPASGSRGGGETSPYALKAIPKSPLPVRFVRDVNAQ